MKDIQWSNVLLLLFHGGLMLAAAYAAAHADKYGWAVAPLMTMASLSNAPKWAGVPADTPAPATPPAAGAGGPAQVAVSGGPAAPDAIKPGALHMLS